MDPELLFREDSSQKRMWKNTF